MKLIVLSLLVCAIASMVESQKQVKIKEPQTKLTLPRTNTYYGQVLMIRNSPGRCLCKTVLGSYHKIAAFGVYSSNMPGVDSRAVTLIFNMAPMAIMTEIGISETFKGIYAKYKDPNDYIRGLVEKLRRLIKSIDVKFRTSITILYSPSMRRMSLWVDGASVVNGEETCDKKIEIAQPESEQGKIVTVCSAVFDHFVTALNYA